MESAQHVPIHEMGTDFGQCSKISIGERNCSLLVTHMHMVKIIEFGQIAGKERSKLRGMGNNFREIVSARSKSNQICQIVSNGV